MIELKFEGGKVIIPNLDNYSHIFGNGATRVCFLDGKQVDNYVMLNDRKAPEPSYVDICETVGGECVVVAHLPILSAKVDVSVYDEAFVEHFAESCDERAWEDDLHCALDNENDNVSHWVTVQECGLSEEDSERCQEIYDHRMSGDWEFVPENENSVDEFGAYIARTYEKQIRERIAYYQKELMEMARDSFLYSLQVGKK